MLLRGGGGGGRAYRLNYEISLFHDTFYFNKLQFRNHNIVQRIRVKIVCTKRGKGFRIGTSEAYNIKIKIRLGGLSKIFCFCSHANMAA